MGFINGFDKNKGYFSSDYDSTDDESTNHESIIPDNDLITDNSISITEQSNTSENLVIDENNASNDTKQSEAISNT